MTGMQLQDMKLADHWAGHENAGHEITGHEIAGHENTGHENAIQETSSEAADVWGWIDWVVCYDSRNVEDQSRVGLIHRLERNYLLQRLVGRLPCQRWHRRQQQTTAVRCVWSGDETVSHLSRVATRVSVLTCVDRFVTGHRLPDLSRGDPDGDACL